MSAPTRGRVLVPFVAAFALTALGLVTIAHAIRRYVAPDLADVFEDER